MLDTLLAGFVHGNTYALVALGVSLIFGVTRVVSFAQGSVFAIGGMAGWWLTAQAGWPLWTALIASAALAGLIGAGINFFGVRPFRKMPHVAALLATFALAMILDNVSRMVFGADHRAYDQLLQTSNFSIGTFRFGTLHVVIVAVTIAAMLLLGGFLRFTKYGRAIRATAQDSDAAVQMGVPVVRVEYISFIVASALGGLGGVLVGMYNGVVSPTFGVSAGLTAFAAATLGGMGSLPGAIVGGVLLGIVEAFGITWLGDGARDLITFGALLLVLWLRPSGILGRKVITKEPLTGTYLGGGRPFLMKKWQVLVLVVVAIGVMPFVASNYYLTVGTQVIVYAMLGLSLVLISGFAGQISIGQMAPVAIGAYTAAIMAKDAGLPFWIALPSAGLIAAVLSIILVLPTWRLSGHYVAIATLGIGAFTVAIALNADWLTRGALGIMQIPSPEIFGYTLRGARDFYLFDLIILLLVLALVVRLRNTPLATIWKGVAADEVALKATGIRPSEYKTMAFLVGAFIAGVAGALLAYQYTYIDPTSFTIDMSMLALTIIVLGAMRSPFGAVLGAIILVGGPELLRLTDDLRLIAYGVLLLILIRFRPQGLWAKRLA